MLLCSLRLRILSCTVFTIKLLFALQLAHDVAANAFVGPERVDYFAVIERDVVAVVGVDFALV